MYLEIYYCKKCHQFMGTSMDCEGAMSNYPNIYLLNSLNAKLENEHTIAHNNTVDLGHRVICVCETLLGYYFTSTSRNTRMFLKKYIVNINKLEIYKIDFDIERDALDKVEESLVTKDIITKPLETPPTERSHKHSHHASSLKPISNQSSPPIGSVQSYSPAFGPFGGRPMGVNSNSIHPTLPASSGTNTVNFPATFHHPVYGRTVINNNNQTINRQPQPGAALAGQANYAHTYQQMRPAAYQIYHHHVNQYFQQVKQPKFEGIRPHLQIRPYSNNMRPRPISSQYPQQVFNYGYNPSSSNPYRPPNT
eukprot:NODE_111_length_18624_cov_1.285020.p4 type:complete len:308 gc:universal NODE_111_length_18624_cov_1.285020:11761-12684(+)